MEIDISDILIVEDRSRPDKSYRVIFDTDAKGLGKGEFWQLLNSVGVVFHKSCYFLEVVSGELPEKLEIFVPVAEEEKTRGILGLLRYDITSKTENILSGIVPQIFIRAHRNLPKGFHCQKEIGCEHCAINECTSHDEHGNAINGSFEIVRNDLNLVGNDSIHPFTDEHIVDKLGYKQDSNKGCKCGKYYSHIVETYCSRQGWERYDKHSCKAYAEAHKRNNV